MSALRVGVSLVVVILFGSFAQAADEEQYRGYFAPPTLVDLLRPDKKASTVRSTLEKRGIALKKEGEAWTFACPPETVKAGFAAGADGMVAGSAAVFELSDKQVESFRKTLLSVFGREGKQKSCKPERCTFAMKGWTVQVDAKVVGTRGVLAVTYERTGSSGKTANEGSDPAADQSSAAAPGPKAETDADWSQPHSRGPYATGGFNYKDGSTRWRTGDLPPGASPGSLAGVWGRQRRDGDWDYRSFFLKGGLYRNPPDDGMNLLVAKGELEAGLREYSVKGDLLSESIGTAKTTKRLVLLEHPEGKPLSYSHKTFLRLYRSPSTRLCLADRFTSSRTCYRRLDLCPESWTLDGTWHREWSDVSGGFALAPSGFVYESASGNRSSVTSSTAYVDTQSFTWRFRKDGTVTYSRGAETTTAVAPGGGVKSGQGSANTKRGTYRLQGCELQVKWSDGKREYRFVRSEQGYDNPRSLLIDESAYERK